MDPDITLAMAIAGDKEARHDYNEWIDHGGFTGTVKAWTELSMVPQIIHVQKVGPKFIRGILGLTNKQVRILVSNVIA